jgi:hypothetical protein
MLHADHAKRKIRKAKHEKPGKAAAPKKIRKGATAHGPKSGGFRDHP